MLGRVTPEFRLAPLRVEGAEALSVFEAASRDWFEQRVPPRPNAYFDPAALAVILQGLLDGAEAEQARSSLSARPTARSWGAST